MLRKAHDLMDFHIHASDGDLGHVDDFYFDEQDWTVRYMIIQTGPWFFGKRVLVSPTVVRALLWDEAKLDVALTQEQIKNSPDVNVEAPITREQELELANYYTWPTYWPAPSLATPVTMPMGVPYVPAQGILGPSTGMPISGTESSTESEVRRAAQERGISHVHSMKNVIGHHIAASDGDIGHVEDFFVDEDNWKINYLLVDTSNWLPGRRVLIAPDWITEIVWADSRVHVKVSREQVKDSPEYDPVGPPDRGYETSLYGHYNSPPYWTW